MARKSARKHKAASLKRAAENTWAVCGIDASVTSISGAMLVYDSLLDKVRDVGVHSVRWTQDVHFLDRLAYAVKAHDFIHELIIKCGPMPIHSDNIWIGMEEAWPAGIVKRAESQWLRQQAEICGAFRGGLVRYGYSRVYDVNASSWRAAVAHDMGMKSNKDFTKWHVKKWAMFSYGIEDRPDLIQKTGVGLTPKPEKSTAKPKQPDDIYDACGIMDWMRTVRERELD